MRNIAKICIVAVLLVSQVVVTVHASPSENQTVKLTNLLSNVQSISVGDAVQVFPPHSGWAEVTTAAYGPGENSSCPNGRLFFGAGDTIAATDLTGQLATLPGNAPNPWSATLNETYPPYIIYDNQLVKLQTGELVYTFEGVTWNDNVNPHPSWWNYTATYPLKGKLYPGGRGNIYVYRSSDCGAAWIHVSDIDAAKLNVPTTLADANSPAAVDTVGLCGAPRLKHTGINYSEAGGWDGHYLYADPYSNHLYLSTICIYGDATVGNEYWEGLLITSQNKGNTWSVIAYSTNVPQMWLWRTPLSSNNAGKIGYAFEDGISQTKMVVFDNTATSVDLSTAVTVASFTGGSLPSAIKTDTAGMIAYPTLVGDNLNPARFYLAQPSVQPNGEVTFNFYNTNGTSSVQTGETLHPVTTGGSTFHGTLVDPRPDSTLSVFYWTDVSPASPNTYRERFQVFSHGEPLLAAPGELTLFANHAYSYAYESGQFMGDYYSGATYVDSHGNINFVCPWNENGALVFNTIVIGPPVERAWAAAWNTDGLIQQDAEFTSVPRSLIDLSSFLLSNGQIRFNAVWAPHAAPWNTWAGIYTSDDLISKDASLRAQGYQMIDISAVVYPGDAVRYNAVWTKTTENHPWVGGWKDSDLITKDSQEKAQGYQMTELSAFVLSGDLVRYNAVWRPMSNAHTFVGGWTLADLGNQDTTLRAQGYVMTDISGMMLSGNQPRYNAVWEKTRVPHTWIAGWAPADFTAQSAAMQLQGYRITELNAIVLSGDQVRYNAIWEPLPKVYLPLVKR